MSDQVEIKAAAREVCVAGSGYFAAKLSNEFDFWRPKLAQAIKRLEEALESNASV